MSRQQMRAAGYIRVSTEEQKRNGWNLEADRQRIQEIAEANGWELVDIFDDGGRQGDDPDRPGFNGMLDALDRLDVIVMRSLDRLSRDTFLYALATKAIRAAGVAVYTFNGPVDLDTPEGELATNVLAAIARFEKRQTGARVRQSVQARARNGRHIGRAPYGYRSVDKALVVVPDEAKIVQRIFRDYVNGVGQRGIVRALNADMVPAPYGGPWHQSRVTKILNAQVYLGKIEYNGQLLDGAHEAIITEEVWRDAEAIRTDAHRRKGGRHPDGAHLLTRGMLRCPKCGSAMIPRKARPGVERERYVCGGRIERGPGFCSQPSIHRELIDEPFLAHLLDGYVDLDATLKRIEEGTASALTLAREALAQAEAELQRADARVARVRRGWQAASSMTRTTASSGIRSRASRKPPRRPYGAPRSTFRRSSRPD